MDSSESITFWDRIWAWLLDAPVDSQVQIERLHLASPWAHGPHSLFWGVLGVAVLLAGSIVFYLVAQHRGHVVSRLMLGITRGLLLGLLFFTLAEPVLEGYTVQETRPVLYVLVDGTDSMEIVDDFLPEEIDKLNAAVALDENADLKKKAEQNGGRLTRLDYVRGLLSREEKNLLARLQDEGGFRVETFVFQGDDASRLRKVTAGQDRVDPPEVAAQLKAGGKVTNLASVMEESNAQLRQSDLKGVLLFSDFAHNSGLSAVAKAPGDKPSAAARAGAPIYTVGLGAKSARRLGVEVEPPPQMKRAEPATIQVRVRQEGLAGQQARVTLFGRLAEEKDDPWAKLEKIDEQTITLEGVRSQIVDFPYTPEKQGRMIFHAVVTLIGLDETPVATPSRNIATVEELQQYLRDLKEDPEQRVTNVDDADSTVLDDYLRLLYVVEEPTWEWRFVKEVFHRDPLVGMRGFRTYLASSDPKVRETNELYLGALTPNRREFFKTDVIFLGDMPGSDLAGPFSKATKEFVTKFGGGLVVVAGPQHGPGELAETELADILPVVVDSRRKRVDVPFTPRQTVYATTGEYSGLLDFGTPEAPRENAEAWENLRNIPWFQPVARPHPVGTTVLLEHPTAKCDDGSTPQPILAVRRFPSGGEVYYLAFNEMWRLRRLHGEKYYRRFWAKLIKRLALNHALGANKRFDVRTDDLKYRPGQKVTLSVRAYDLNYQPLGSDPEVFAGKSLKAQLTPPDENGRPGPTRQISIPELKPGVFELRQEFTEPGNYMLQVLDPLTEEYTAPIHFRVTAVSAERSAPQRNADLQAAIARESGGQALEKIEVDALAERLRGEPITLREPSNAPLWRTPLWFILIVGLAIGEWLTRKLIRLK